MPKTFKFGNKYNKFLLIALITLIIGVYFYNKSKSSFSLKGAEYSKPMLIKKKGSLNMNFSRATINPLTGLVYKNAAVYVAPAGAVSGTTNQDKANNVSSYVFRNKIKLPPHNSLAVGDDGSFEVHNFVNYDDRITEKVSLPLLKNIGINIRGPEQDIYAYKYQIIYDDTFKSGKGTSGKTR